VRFAESHDIGARDRHYRRWSFIAVLGTLPSFGALLSGLFLIREILPKTHSDIYIYAYLFAWGGSVTPAMIFTFRHAGPKLGKLDYPGYQKTSL
jgi:hypothetical protein